MYKSRIVCVRLKIMSLHKIYVIFFCKPYFPYMLALPILMLLNY